MAERKRRGRKVVTDLTGRTDVSTEEIIKGLTPPPSKRGKKKTKWEKAAEEAGTEIKR